ncbi:hypothetical protein VP01_1769g3 [Puccinia sorghi]|uniref:Uncharacterized protein n=1 Tax=Puccinia sorghi TaxID=27349 RepID=A0A0L6VEV0_9BASI|nr:hypothetical protein VP01_1769g3 [Puccinia sorghi]
MKARILTFEAAFGSKLSLIFDVSHKKIPAVGFAKHTCLETIKAKVCKCAGSPPTCQQNIWMNSLKGHQSCINNKMHYVLHLTSGYILENIKGKAKITEESSTGVFKLKKMIYFLAKPSHPKWSIAAIHQSLMNQNLLCYYWRWMLMSMGMIPHKIGADVWEINAFWKSSTGATVVTHSLFFYYWCENNDHHVYLWGFISDVTHSLFPKVAHCFRHWSPIHLKLDLFVVDFSEAQSNIYLFIYLNVYKNLCIRGNHQIIIGSQCQNSDLCEPPCPLLYLLSFIP